MAALQRPFTPKGIKLGAGRAAHGQTLLLSTDGGNNQHEPTTEGIAGLVASLALAVAVAACGSDDKSARSSSSGGSTKQLIKKNPANASKT